MLQFLPKCFELFHVTTSSFAPKQILMTEDTIKPIIQIKTISARLGRRADILAALLAGLGAGLSALTALWFFFGFAENDTRPEHLASAFALTLILFAFAIIPFACVAHFARRAYRMGTNRPHLLWTLFLMLPWVGLGVIAVSHTPLPVFWGIIITALAALLALWALVSALLDWNSSPANTLLSQQNEMSDASE